MESQLDNPDQLRAFLLFLAVGIPGLLVNMGGVALVVDALQKPSPVTAAKLMTALLMIGLGAYATLIGTGKRTQPGYIFVLLSLSGSLLLAPLYEKVLSPVITMILFALATLLAVNRYYRASSHPGGRHDQAPSI